jgi:hypothetical protein
MHCGVIRGATPPWRASRPGEGVALNDVSSRPSAALANRYRIECELGGGGMAVGPFCRGLNRARISL